MCSRASGRQPAPRETLRQNHHNAPSAEAATWVASTTAIGAVTHLQPGKAIPQDLHHLCPCHGNRLWLRSSTGSGGSPAAHGTSYRSIESSSAADTPSGAILQYMPRQKSKHADGRPWGHVRHYLASAESWLREYGSKASPSVEAQAVDGGGAGHRACALPDLLRHPSVIVLIMSLLLSSAELCHRAACRCQPVQGIQRPGNPPIR